MEQLVFDGDGSAGCRKTPPAVALLPLMSLFVIAVAASWASRRSAERVRRRQERDGAKSHSSSHRSGHARGMGIAGARQRAGMTGGRIIAASGLLIVTIARVSSGNEPWGFVFDVGVLLISIALIALPLGVILLPGESERLENGQRSVAAVACIFCLVLHMSPFFYASRPSFDASDVLGVTQASLASLIVLLIILEPTPASPFTSPSKLAREDTASPLSRHLFSYLEPGMLKYFLGHTSFEDTLSPLPERLETKAVEEKFQYAANPDEGEEENNEEKNRSRGGMVKFCWIYRSELLYVLAYASVWIVGIFSAPLSLNLLLQHIQDPTAPSRFSPYLYVLGIFLSPIASSIAYQCAQFVISELGLRLRSALGLAVFRKILRAREGGDDEGSGRVTNLVGTDSDVITSSLDTSLQILAIPPKLVVSLVSLYFLLGWSAFVAFGTILAFSPLSVLVSKQYGSVQGEIMKATDRRITLVRELVGAIRTVKALAWETFSKKRIEEARRVELERIKARAWVFGGMMLLSTGVPTAVTLATFASFVFGQHRTLSASTAFTSMALFGLLREAVISSTYLASALMRAQVSLKRISHFVSTAEELDKSPIVYGKVLKISKATFRWSKETLKQDFTLKIDHLEFPHGKTTIIAGDVGSGKSALLYALLGEMHRVDGEVSMLEGAISYAGQLPWLQDETIKANILFTDKYDEERYNKVIFQCALEDDLHAMPQGDQTKVGDKGLSVSGGQKQRIALARAVYAKSEVVILDDVLSAVDSNTVSHLLERCLNGDLLEGRTIILVTHYVDQCVRQLNNCNLLVRLHEGRIQSLMDPSETRGTRTPLESPTEGLCRQRIKEKKVEAPSSSATDDEAAGQISWQVYRQYFLAMGGSIFWLVYAAINIVAHVLMLAQGAWISRWVDAAGQRNGFFFAMYGLIQLGTAISLSCMYLYLLLGALKASRILHKSLTDSIFGSYIRFFDTTPFGNIVNRFSKDTETTDTEIVEQTQPVMDYAVSVFLLSGPERANLTIQKPAAILAGLFYLVGQLYITNALAARKNVANARSPLFSTLSDVETGIATIRAFSRLDFFSASYVDRTDTYNRRQLHEYALERWLEERSDFVGGAVSGIVGLLALRGGLSSGVTGFLVSTGLEFTSRILYVVRAINQQQLSINSAHRIIQYSKISQEPKVSSKTNPPASWPHDGSIEFKDYSARYGPELDDVLRGISFTVKGGERIGICGPSGCGKSSLALALLRFLEQTNGQIVIDGRKLEETSLEALRSRVSLTPQDPTLFSGTIRSNLDPEEEYDDAVLWHAVQKSRLVRGSGQNGGNHRLSLDTPVLAGGSNFSQGQRQLLSLARALVRGSKIVIFDEATASLDYDTDRTIQKVIREEFSGATNLTIAHRLESIIDFDKVLVLDGGCVAEFDTPRALLEQHSSRFSRMVESSGKYEELFKLTQNQ